MISHFPAIYTAKESIRYQFRANHIYILMSALINIVSALYLRPISTGWRTMVSWASSSLLLIAPLMLITAFFVEPVHGGPSRPLTFFGIVMLLIGTITAHVPNISAKARKENIKSVEVKENL